MEQGRGFSFWFRFGELSLSVSLEGLSFSVEVKSCNVRKRCGRTEEGSTNLNVV